MDYYFIRNSILNILFITVTVYSQNDTLMTVLSKQGSTALEFEVSGSSVIPNAIMKIPPFGTKALEFEMDGLLNLSGHIGKGITYKKFYDNNRAIRIGLFYDITSSEDTGKEISENYNPNSDNTDIVERNIDVTINANDIYAVIQFIKYFKPFHRAALYYGIGPIIGYEKKINRIEYAPDYGTWSPSNQENKNKVSLSYTGLSATVGVEWFFHDIFSLTTEYYTFVKFGKKYYDDSSYSEYENGSWNKNSVTKKGNYYEISSRALIGISVYFG